jgi:uncharacterized protein (TIRG00374 family)
VSLLALITFTPGGLGFVEAELVGTLTLAGVKPVRALVATLVYRLVSFWLLIPVGGGVWGALTRFASKSPRILAVPTGYRARAAARHLDQYR